MRRLALLAVTLVSFACTEGKAEDSPAKSAGPIDEATASTPEAAEAASVRAGGRIEVKVDGEGYHPAEIQAPANAEITLAFRRADAKNCGETLVIESLGIEKDLPAGQTVEVAITTPASGTVGFACGMNMYKGKVVVVSRG
jgi:plastocyanin domain-containing protein